MPKLPQGRNLLFSVQAKLWQDAHRGPPAVREAARATHQDILTYYKAAFCHAH